MDDKTMVLPEIQHAMQAAVEVVPVAKLLVGDLSHSRHYSHAEYDVNGIGKRRPDLGEGRAQWTHEIRDDIHRPSAHATAAKGVELLIHLRRESPVVGGTCVYAAFGA